MEDAKYLSGENRVGDVKVMRERRPQYDRDERGGSWAGSPNRGLLTFSSQLKKEKSLMEGETSGYLGGDMEKRPEVERNRGLLFSYSGGDRDWRKGEEDGFQREELYLGGSGEKEIPFLQQQEKTETEIRGGQIACCMRKKGEERLCKTTPVSVG